MAAQTIEDARREYDALLRRGMVENGDRDPDDFRLRASADEIADGWDDLIVAFSLARPKFYVIFDGPPGVESGRFVEVEAAVEGGESVGVGKWTQRGDGMWALGPFVEAAR